MRKITLLTAAGLLFSSTALMATGYPNPHNPNLQTGGNDQGNNGCGNGNSGNDGQGCTNHDQNRGNWGHGDGTPGHGGGDPGHGGGDPGPGGGDPDRGVGDSGRNTNTNTNTLTNTVAPTNTNTSLNTNTNLVSNNIGPVTSTSMGGSGGSVSDSGNSTNSLTNTATGGAVSLAPGALTSNASADNSGNSTASADGSGNSNTVVTVAGGNTTIRHRKIPVATAYAPPVSSGIDTCSGGVSAGAQTRVFGFSFGGTKRDKTCEVIKLSRELDNQGYGYEACQVLVNEDPRVARAFTSTGRSCMATVSYEDAAPVVLTPGLPVPDHRIGERG